MQIEGFKVPGAPRPKEEVIPFSTDGEVKEMLVELSSVPYDDQSPELKRILDQIKAYLDDQNRPETTLQ